MPKWLDFMMGVGQRKQKEGFYDLYHSSYVNCHTFFWNEVVYSTDNMKKALMPDYNSDKIYFSDGTILSATDVGASYFLEIYDNKYIFAKGDDNVTLGIIGSDGNWIIEAVDDLWNIFRSSNSDMYIRGDILVIEYYDYNDGFYVVYYNLLTKTYTVIDGDDILASFCDNSTKYLQEIVHVNDKIELVYGEISEEERDEIYDFGIRSLYTINNRYILIETRQYITMRFADKDYTKYISVYSVCDNNLNWIVKSIPADRLKWNKDYLYVESDSNYIENGYYDLRTGDFFITPPNDFDTGNDDNANEELNNPNKFDYYSIENFYKASDCVNGKTAVALWNSDVSELYITIINEYGDFLFEPIKTPIHSISSSITGVPIFFDGEYIVIADNTGCGSGHIYSSLTLYTYGINGKIVAEWKASDSLHPYNCSFSYKDGVIVFWLLNGQYSDYYRQSGVKYYTYDFKPLFE